MLTRALAALTLSTLLLAGCTSTAAEPAAAPASPTVTASAAAEVTSSTSPSATPTPTPTKKKKADPQAAVRKAVTRYSDAFLDGEASSAYDLLSKRCRSQFSRSYFTGIVMAAKSQYGKALPIREFSAKVRSDLAVVSYGYDVPALDQENETWVLEGGRWHNDDC